MTAFTNKSTGKFFIDDLNKFVPYITKVKFSGDKENYWYAEPIDFTFQVQHTYTGTTTTADFRKDLINNARMSLRKIGTTISEYSTNPNNIISKALTSGSKYVASKVSSMISGSNTYGLIKSYQDFFKYFEDSNIQITIPQINVWIFPVIQKNSVVTAETNLQKLLKHCIGNFAANVITTDTKITNDNESSTKDSSYGALYEYMSPGGYKPTDIDETNTNENFVIRLHHKNTWSVSSKGITVNNLILSSANITPSQSVVNYNSGNNRAYFIVSLEFQPATIYTPNDLRQILHLTGKDSSYTGSQVDSV